MNKPNIILLIAEELGAKFIGYSGNHDAKTPFLDSLSKKGINFANHFSVHGKCVPSRAALYSGRYCHNGGHRTLGIELQHGEISLAHLLKKHGYHNILIGKNHTIAPDILPKQFNEHWTGGRHGEKAVSYLDYEPNTTSNNRNAGIPQADNYLFGKINVDEKHTTDYIHTKRLCNFLHNRSHKQPFFINLNFHYTHPPYEIMEPYYSYFMNKDLHLFPPVPGNNKPDFMYKMHEIYGFSRLSEYSRKEMHACYYGQLAFLDNRIKEIYQALEASERLNNTILIFTSDHGDLVGQHGLPEKWDTIFSDSIMKIPLLIYYPKHFTSQTITAMTENIDLMPMLLEYIGINKPYGIQGKSLLPLITGQTKEHKEYVFAEGGHEKELLEINIPPDKHRQLIVGYLKKAAIREQFPNSLRKAKMIRTKRHKLIFRIKDKNELYDLETDPLEQDNLYYDPAYKKTALNLEKTLLKHLIETEENLPFDPEPIS